MNALIESQTTEVGAEERMATREAELFGELAVGPVDLVFGHDARLRALATLRPSRDLSPQIDAERGSLRRGRQTRWAGIGGLALLRPRRR